MNDRKTSNSFEPYKRVVKFTSSAVIVLLELAAYYYVWMNYYNKNMTVAFWRRGNWLIAGEYLVLSLVLHRLLDTRIFPHDLDHRSQRLFLRPGGPV